ncbi:MAG: ribosomal protein S18-alanine N-acetyltransferase [Lentisphaeria bacterium]|nr:ribosomal protein S18-alanine N-acetyltransferase [Candidatus Neomarinimicrobiota bacterium]MCF7841325.1 ribosomal protein S18-alanine N-acetyltransferase [Lentisphaeria bacterium]
MATAHIRHPTGKFRAIVSEDIPNLARLERELFAQPWTEGMLTAALADYGARHQLFEQGDVILGYFFLTRIVDEAELHNIAVPRQFQHRGIGRYMLEKIVNQCDAEQIERLYLEVREDNTAAIHLYEKMGFECIGRRPGYYVIEKRDALIYMRTKHELV